MARTTKIRYYKKKGIWSANINQFRTTQTLQGNAINYGYNILCENPAQSITTVSQQYTVKNIDIMFNAEVGANPNYIEDIVYYIMYVPQGMTIDNNYSKNHPEYIMAMRYIGSAQSDSNTRTPTRVKTRLARRLQTGDKIILYFTCENQSGNDISADISGIVRWCSSI